MSKLKDTPKIDRPREKFLKKGPDSLSKSELLAILIGSGIKGKNVKKLSEQIIRKFGNKFLNLKFEELIDISGIGEAKALQIVSALALVKRYHEELESKEYIVSHKEKEGNMPDKAVYTITDKGNDYFNRLMNDISNYDVSLYLDFNIIITNLDLVDDEQKKILVSNIKSKILELKELLNERQSHRQHIPNVGKQMFKQQLALVETLEKWIIDFENSLKGQN